MRIILNRKNNVETMTSKLLRKLPKDQIKKVFGQGNCDIGGEFLGFIDVYESLAKIIPKHFTVIDFGCAYNPQCFYFTKHKQYVAVDISDCVKFQSDNCTIYQKSIRRFIVQDLYRFNLNETFVICNYVPDYECCELVRQTFKNLFVFYPHGGF